MEVKKERTKPRSYTAMMAGGLELRSNRVQLKLSGVKGTNLGRTVREPSRHLPLSVHHNYGHAPQSFANGATTETPINQVNPLRKVMVHP